jgi:hypothetical protein
MYRAELATVVSITLVKPGNEVALTVEGVIHTMMMRMSPA